MSGSNSHLIYDIEDNEFYDTIDTDVSILFNIATTLQLILPSEMSLEDKLKLAEQYKQIDFKKLRKHKSDVVKNMLDLVDEHITNAEMFMIL